MSNFSIFKQIITEKFDKDRKTQDPDEFLTRVKILQANEKKIGSYMSLA